MAPDIIVNAAAYTAVDRAEVEPEEAAHINHLAVAKIADYCAQNSCYLLHVSTDYVFDGATRTPYRECDAAQPKGVYGASKLAGERAIQASGCEYIILRTSAVYSEYGANFLKTMLRLVATGKPLEIVADQIVAPTYAQDIARALVVCIQCFDRDPLPTGIYHYGGDRACSWYDFATEIFAAAASDVLTMPEQLIAIATADYPTAAQRPAYSVLNSDKFTHATGLAASKWYHGIQATLSALRRQS